MAKTTEELGTTSLGPANRSLEELEYNWTQLRWRIDGAMEEGRLARDPHNKREINRGNFTLVDENDPRKSRQVSNGVLSPPAR